MPPITWALHNTLKGWTLYDLTSSEVQLLVHVMSTNEIRLCQVCQKGASAWQPLSETTHPDLFSKKLNNNSNGYPELEPVGASKTNSGANDTDYFVVSPTKKVLPRLHTRHDVIVACSIRSAKNVFATETVDLSEGGLHFKDLLPDWIAGYFLVAVTTPDGIFQLMCSLVEDQKEKKRVQVVSEESDPQYLLFKNWLLTLK